MANAELVNIFNLISEIIAVVLANVGTIEGLIQSKNWVGLTEELVTLANEIVASFSTKAAAVAQAGVNVAPAHSLTGK